MKQFIIRFLMDKPTSIPLLNPSHQEGLRRTISFTNFQLHELAQNNEKFVATVRKLNNEAKLKIVDDHPKLALVYLGQAEKVLEYVANCGKNIDRNLIVCVLHNEACCYQKLWELEKCSNYLQALIYNVECHLRSDEENHGVREENKINQQSQTDQDFLASLAGKSIKNRIQLSKYYLQFCAITSQLKNHQKALDLGKKAILIIKALLKQLELIAEEKRCCQSPPIHLTIDDPEDYEIKRKIVGGVAAIEDEPLPQLYLDYLSTAQYYFKKWNIKKQNNKNESIKETLKTFSIGSIMQLKPLLFEENRQSTFDNENIQQFILESQYEGDPLEFQSYLSIVQLVLMLCVGYFTIATELRLIGSEKMKGSKVDKSGIKEHKESEIYHLITLIITSVYVPFDMLLMRHIVTSFNNHYNNDLTSEIQRDSATIMKSFDKHGLASDHKKQIREFKRETALLDYTTSIKMHTSSITENDIKTPKIKPNTHTKKKYEKILRNLHSTPSRNKPVSKTKSEIIQRIRTQISPIKEKKFKKIESKARKTKYKTEQKKKKKQSLSRDSKKSQRKGKKQKLESGQEYFKQLLKKEQRKLKEMKSTKNLAQKRKQKQCLVAKANSPNGISGMKTPLKNNIDKYYF